ncbi:MAG: BamA/TamA family outer membrane protein [Kofleriaceae bacterium]|nr:BamA/TamA family outer membrane protein [Kofleriaceae bacterium]MBP6836223.1 BamA/TamA family outer membrane protein [Kofleriaceae bacterium]
MTTSLGQHGERRSGLRAGAALVVSLVAAVAVAQPAPDGGGAAGDDAGAVGTAPDLGSTALPRPWTEWTLRGQLVDDPATLRAVLAPGVDAARQLADPRPELGRLLKAVGYELIDLRIDGVGSGVRATLAVVPIRLVRAVTVSVDRSLLDLALDDQLARRLRLRVGAALPRDRAELDTALRDETDALREYLRDEGYFDAVVTVTLAESDARSSRIQVKATLGPRYDIGTITVVTGGTTGVTVAEIRALFAAPRLCLLSLCVGQAPFSLARYQASRQKVIELFQRRGYPNVQLADDDPRQSFDRKSKTVRVRLRIDERRQTDVEFEGNDKSRFPDDALRARLTFAEARSADDVEAAASAAAIASYYQERGRFDTQVTWVRERFDQLTGPAGQSAGADGRGRQFDRIYFRIDEGTPRQIRSVTFAGNQALPASQLADVVTVRPYRTLSGGGAATSAQLAGDADRLRRAYADAGYLSAQVTPHAGPTPGRRPAALTAALVASGRGPGQLHVRFDLVEGPRTDVTRLRLVLVGAGLLTEPARRTCRAALVRAIEASAAGADERRRRTRQAVITTTADGCAAVVPQAPLRLALAQAAATAVRDHYREGGQARADAALEVDAGATAGTVTLTYRVTPGPLLRLGKVLVRGNSRTEAEVITQELGFREGALATSQELDAGPRRVRATGLFDAVRIDYLGRDSGDGPVAAIVQVEERYDARALFEAELGQSTRQGTFGRLKATLPNLLGRGLASDAEASYGTLFKSAKSSFKVPRWIVRGLIGAPVSSEATGFWQREDTERFGELTSYGGALAATRLWEREGDERRRGRVTTASLRYDFRVRNRNEDAVRIAGPGADLAAVPVSTRTGSIGLGLRSDGRVGVDNQLNPLAPIDGSLVDLSAALASPYLLGQDAFLKVSATVQLYQRVGRRLGLRADLRFDQGLPLGGRALLPEVERFFAGGDDTVRGFTRDRLKTEILLTDVAPFDGVTQLRVLPAGGNLRGLASGEAQFTLGKHPWLGSVIPATALFVDAGFIENRWGGLTWSDVRPAAGLALRLDLGVGSLSVEYALPLLPRLGDDGNGTWHFGLSFRQ